MQLRSFFLVLLLSLAPFMTGQAANCEAFNKSCSAYCKSSMCHDACGRGESYCRQGGCKKANSQCEAQCAELDSWDAQENCYNACWTGRKQC
jgi:hypothetical protein